MTIEEIKKQYPDKNVRWVVWKTLYNEDLPTIHYIDWIDEKWAEFHKLKYGKELEYLSLSEKEQNEFDNWLISLIEE